MGIASGDFDAAAMRICSSRTSRGNLRAVLNDRFTPVFDDPRRSGSWGAEGPYTGFGTTGSTTTTTVVDSVHRNGAVNIVRGQRGTVPFGCRTSCSTTSAAGSGTTGGAAFDAPESPARGVRDIDNDGDVDIVSPTTRRRAPVAEQADARTSALAQLHVRPPAPEPLCLRAWVA